MLKINVDDKSTEISMEGNMETIINDTLNAINGIYEAFDKKDHLSAELFKIALIGDIKFALMSKKELKDRISSYKDLIKFMDSVFKDNDEDLIKELREAKAKEME